MAGHTQLIGGAALLAAVSFSGRGSAELPANFDKKAVIEALDAVNLTTCKTPRGPTGEGHVVVTLAPNGKITGAVVDAPPFANTKAGKCIEKTYKTVKVPGFTAQSPITLGKKFKLE